MADNQAAPHAKKRVAVYLDGTWNTIHDNTNVWRLRALTAPRGSDGMEQTVFYNSGLGTRYGQKFSGGMFGVGIDDILLDAYEWLVENFNEGDELFIFGFSRGAFTARSLSGFVSRCGLLCAGAPLSIKQLYDRYRQGMKLPTLDHLLNHRPASPSLEEEWLLAYCRSIPIKFIGVFDTVGSLGVPSSFSKFKTEHAFLNTGLRVTNTYAAHAMAVDEHRPDFVPTLWTRSELLTAGALQPTPPACRPPCPTEPLWCRDRRPQTNPGRRGRSMKRSSGGSSEPTPTSAAATKAISSRRRR